MAVEGPIDVERVLEEAHFAVVAGKIVTEYDDEIALHEPLRRVRERPVEIGPATEAALREHLGEEGVPQPRRYRPDCGDR